MINNSTRITNSNTFNNSTLTDSPVIAGNSAAVNLNSAGSPAQAPLPSRGPS